MKVWQDSMVLAKPIWICTQLFPVDEKFGMVTQMRRCAVSIPSNIAEGAGRSSNKEFSYFLGIALGSAFELETQVLLSCDFGYMDTIQKEELLILNSNVQKMLNGLRNSLVIK